MLYASFTWRGENHSVPDQFAQLRPGTNQCKVLCDAYRVIKSMPKATMDVSLDMDNATVRDFYATFAGHVSCTRAHRRAAVVWIQDPLKRPTAMNAPTAKSTSLTIEELLGHLDDVDLGGIRQENNVVHGVSIEGLRLTFTAMAPGLVLGVTGVQERVQKRRSAPACH
jgi:hypothetical protein